MGSWEGGAGFFLYEVLPYIIPMFPSPLLLPLVLLAGAAAPGARAARVRSTARWTEHTVAYDADGEPRVESVENDFECDLRCRHGGKRVMSDDGVCGCRCPGQWQGKACGTCPLVDADCVNGDLDRASCTCIDCRAPWSGPLCKTCTLGLGGVAAAARCEIDPETCACGKCNPPWGGPDCDQCLRPASHCQEGSELDTKTCTCVGCPAGKAPPGATPNAAPFCGPCPLTECEHFGTVDPATCTCTACPVERTGLTCGTCKYKAADCQHGGSLDADCCMCTDCDKNWGGVLCAQCQRPEGSCLNGGTLDKETCKCKGCASPWAGEFCERCELEDSTCAHGGAVCRSSCRCHACDAPWTGPRCRKCGLVDEDCQHGSVSEEAGTCKCDCEAPWLMDPASGRCTQCGVTKETCGPGSVPDPKGCRCIGAEETTTAPVALVETQAHAGARGGARTLRGAMLLRQERDRASTAAAPPAPDALSAGTLVSCSWTGVPDKLDAFVGDQEPYFGRTREGYLQHLFVASECEGGALPDPRKGIWMASVHSVYSCGKPEQWSVISPNEQDGPGIMWWNSKPCSSGAADGNDSDDGSADGAASVRVDFFLPKPRHAKYLHRCVWQGAPSRFVRKGPASAPDTTAKALSRDIAFRPWQQSLGDMAISPLDRPGSVDDAASGGPAHRFGSAEDARFWADKDGDDWTDSAPGYHRHVFESGDCSNGLPEYGDATHTCFVSHRWGESCGCDADWAVVVPQGAAAGAPATEWYTGQECTHARVAADFFCPPSEDKIDFPQAVHTCTFQGPGQITPCVGGGGDHVKANALARSTNGATSKIATREAGGHGENIWCGSASFTGIRPTPQRCGEHCQQAQFMWNSLNGECACNICEHPDRPAETDQEHWEFYRFAASARSANGVNGEEGQCRSHAFTDAECTNGLPGATAMDATRDCMVATREFVQCGSALDLETKVGAGGSLDVSWYTPTFSTGRAGVDGTCGTAKIVLDVLCVGTCPRVCQHGGTLDRPACRCDCPRPFAGDNCETCALGEKDCHHGTVVDSQQCTCVQPDDGNPWGGPYGDTCTLSAADCPHGGRLDAESCACVDCDAPWAGPRCKTCTREQTACKQGASLNAETCECDIHCPTWGPFCSRCPMSAVDGKQWECAGRGACEVGQCVCDENSVDGDACEHLLADTKGCAISEYGDVSTWDGAFVSGWEGRGEVVLLDRTLRDGTREQVHVLVSGGTNPASAASAVAVRRTPSGEGAQAETVVVSGATEGVSLMTTKANVVAGGQAYPSAAQGVSFSATSEASALSVKYSGDGYVVEAAAGTLSVEMLSWSAPARVAGAGDRTFFDVAVEAKAPEGVGKLTGACGNYDGDKGNDLAGGNAGSHMACSQRSGEKSLFPDDFDVAAFVDGGPDNAGAECQDAAAAGATGSRFRSGVPAAVGVQEAGAAAFKEAPLSEDALAESKNCKGPLLAQAVGACSRFVPKTGFPGQMTRASPELRPLVKCYFVACAPGCDVAGHCTEDGVRAAGRMVDVARRKRRCLVPKAEKEAAAARPPKGLAALAARVAGGENGVCAV